MAIVRRHWRHSVTSFRSLYYLYIDLYRNIIESAPTYALSQVHACDKEKLDLLLLANDPEKSPYDCSAIKLKPPVPLDFSADVDANIPDVTIQVKLLQDHFLAIARCAYRIDSYTLWQSVDEAINKLIKNDSFKSNSKNFNFARKKVEIDFRILRDEPTSIKNLCIDYLKETGLSPYHLNCIQQITSECFSKTNKTLLKPDALDKKLLDLSQQIINGIVTSDNQGDLSPLFQLLDMLYRYAEVLMLMSDSDKDRERSKLKIFLSFLEAHAVFLLTNHIRRYIFQWTPINNRYRPSADAIRNAVRLELKLVKDLAFLNPVLEESTYHIWRKHFLRYGRHYNDLYTLHWSKERTPDQVSQLLLEAATARILSRPSEKKSHLQLAYDLVSRADTMLVNLRSRPRLRMRQMLEKCKCARLLAQMYADEKPLTESAKIIATRYHGIFEFAVNQLNSLVEYHSRVLNIDTNTGLWERLAGKQTELLEAFPLESLFKN